MNRLYLELPKSMKLPIYVEKKMSEQEKEKFKEMAKTWVNLNNNFKKAEVTYSVTARKNPSNPKLPTLADKGFKFFYQTNQQGEKIWEYIIFLKQKYGRKKH